MNKDEALVVVEQGFARSSSDVWQAITAVDEMRKWYFENIPEFARESCMGGWNYFIKDSLKKYLDG